MKHGYVICALVCLFVGAAIGHRFFPRTELREVPVTVTQTKTLTRTVEKLVGGEVVERVVEKEVNASKTRPHPAPVPPQYRLGALMPLGKDLPTVTASRRLFGSVWAEAQYDLRHHEVTVGVSYEF